MSDAAMKPCPFCGCTTVKKRNNFTAAAIYHECDWCDAEGPAELPNWDPPQGWNIRPEEDRLRALLKRAHDAMSRREPDGISAAEWDQLLQDIKKEIGT